MSLPPGRPIRLVLHGNAVTQALRNAYDRGDLVAMREICPGLTMAACKAIGEGWSRLEGNSQEGFRIASVPRQPLACPTAAQVVAMLNAHGTHAMWQACRLTGCEAIDLVVDAVDCQTVTWEEVMHAPCYAIAQIFDDFIDRMEYL